MVNINHSDRAHSPWGASSAERWMACPASIQLSEGIVEGSSKFAAEGTCAHELAEKALVEDKRCDEYIGQEFEGHIVDAEMAEYTQIYVDYVNSAGDGDFKDTIIEERFDLSHVAEGLFGTNDACISEYMGTLEIIDLKYGKGVQVFPENNKQLMYYALGASKGGEFSEVKLTIVQPRVDNPIKSWTCSIERLEEFEQQLKDAVALTKVSNPAMATGDHCRFCKAKAICPQMKKEIQSKVKMDFSAPVVMEDKSLPEPKSMDSKTLVNVLDHVSMIRSWLDAVEKHAYGQLESGKELEGYKLVAKRSMRKYANAKAMEAELIPEFGDAIYAKPKLIGVPAMEKLIGKERAKDFVIKPDAGTTIAPESDKRPAVVNKTVQAFKDAPVTSDDDFDNLTF